MAWFEGRDQLESALDCALIGTGGELAAFVRRRGRDLIAQGFWLRVTEALRTLGTHTDSELEAVLAEA